MPCNFRRYQFSSVSLPLLLFFASSFSFAYSYSLFLSLCHAVFSLCFIRFSISLFMCSCFSVFLFLLFPASSRHSGVSWSDGGRAVSRVLCESFPSTVSGVSGCISKRRSSISFRHHTGWAKKKMWEEEQAEEATDAAGALTRSTVDCSLTLVVCTLLSWFCLVCFVY